MFKESKQKGGKDGWPFAVQSFLTLTNCRPASRAFKRVGGRSARGTVPGTARRICILPVTTNTSSSSSSTYYLSICSPRAFSSAPKSSRREGTRVALLLITVTPPLFLFPHRPSIPPPIASPLPSPTPSNSLARPVSRLAAGWHPSLPREWLTGVCQA